MKTRKISVGAALAAIVLAVPGVALANHQKWTVTLTGGCKDLRMDEAKDDDDCEITASVSPKTPARTVTLQMKSGDSWTKVKSTKTKGGSVSFAISAYDDEESWRDGTVRYRISVSKSGKEKVFTSKQYAIEFTPDAGDGTSDDAGDEESSTVTAAPKTPTATAPKTPAASTPAAPTATTPTAAAPTTPTGGGAAATTTTMAPMPNGGTPTNTTNSGSADANWFPGISASAISHSWCNTADPIYVGATICTGVTTKKSKDELKTLIAPLSKAGPNYRRQGFCESIMWALGGMNVTTVSAKCAEVDAGR